MDDKTGRPDGRAMTQEQFDALPKDEQDEIRAQVKEQMESRRTEQS